MAASNVKVYGYRWVVLAVFMFINLTIQILWICFAPITGPAAKFYGVGELEIGLLAMAFMIVFIPVAIPASWAIDTFGFHRAVGFGAVILGVFGMLRGIYTSNFTMTLIFTIGIAVAQPFILNAFTKVAAKWFALEERATAIGLAQVASFLGVVVGQMLTPFLLDSVGMARMQLIYGIFAAISAIVFIVFARENPPTPASPPGQEQRALVLDGLRQILRLPDFYYLAIVFFLAGGIFNGLETWVESIVSPKGYAPADAGTLGGLMLIGAIVGAIIFPPISDKLRRRKPILLIGLIAAIPGLAAITLSNDYTVLLIAFFVLGFFMIGIAPVIYQLGAEITYPTPEGTSNGLFVLAMQISVVFIFAMGWLNDTLGSFTPSMFALIILLAISAGLIALAHESPMMKNKTELQVDQVSAK
ncbi:MAG: MFS transporter [Chloroflexi bacterium]|nr:MFS transporter [Chloroflexota bacterium]